MSETVTAVRVLSCFFRRLGRGVHRRKSLQQPTPDALDLHRRGELIRRILSLIQNNSILLCGPPGCGKTAMLLHLKQRLEDGSHPFEEYFPIFIDLHGVPENLLFATVADTIAYNLSSTRVLSRRAWASATSSDYGHRNLANDIRTVLHTLRTRGARHARLVLLVDGIDQFNTYAAKTAQQVRSLFMASFGRNLVMVATAVEIDREWEEEGSPWYNFFEEIRLTPLNGQAEQPRHPG